MIAAIVAGAAVLLAIGGAFAWFGVALRDAMRSSTETQVHLERRHARVAALELVEAELRAALAAEKRRADALDLELERVANDGDVAGARERVLSRYRREADGAAEADEHPTGVYTKPEPAPDGGVVGDGLLRPGE